MRFVPILLLLSLGLHAQQFLPDSVRKEFSLLSKDSIYIDKLNAISLEYLKTNPEISRSISENSLVIAQQMRYNRGYARALTMIGNSYWTEGMYEFAQSYYLLAARQYRTINDSTGLGQIYNNIGEVYKKLNDNTKALEYLLQSLALNKNNKNNLAVTLYNVGHCIMSVSFTSAKASLKKLIHT
jgi:tetratricopeptide (TPR) repeat protein